MASSVSSVVKILLLPGSLRHNSTNRGLLRAAEKLFPKDVELTWASARLPLYDGDVEAKIKQPPEVKILWDQFFATDAVLVGNPEYNGSYSGVLKNALDWMSRSVVGPHPLTGLPIASIGSGGGGGTASSSAALKTFVLRLKGEYVESATPVLVKQWAPPTPKFDAEGNLINTETIPLIQSVVDAIVAAARKRHIAKAAAVAAAAEAAAAAAAASATAAPSTVAAAPPAKQAN